LSDGTATKDGGHHDCRPNLHEFTDSAHVPSMELCLLPGELCRMANCRVLPAQAGSAVDACPLPTNEKGPRERAFSLLLDPG
jgi:hypothetical protein